MSCINASRTCNWIDLICLPFLAVAGGSNEEPESASEENRIPGLHTDTEASDAENVVLVRSKEVGTLPRGSKVSYISII